MSSENRVTISKVIPLTKIIRGSLLKLEKEMISDAQPLVQSMLRGVSARFLNLEEVPLLAESTLLDPRFKKRGFESENLYKKAYDSISRMASIVRLEMMEEKVELPTNNELQSGNSVWEDFDREIADEISNNTNRSSSRGIVELDLYIQEAYIPRSANPLQWWEAKKQTCPRLWLHEISPNEISPNAISPNEIIPN